MSRKTEGSCARKVGKRDILEKTIVVDLSKLLGFIDSDD
jgi:hypothetical protein